VRIGHRLLGIVGSNPQLFLDAAARVGITGSAFALAADAAAGAQLEAAAQSHGVLVEASVIAFPLPMPDESFDLALVDDREPRAGVHQTSAAWLADARRVLRPGGRIVIVVPAPSRALAGLFGITPKPPDVGPLAGSLLDAGFIAARLLAAREGVGFVEAARPKAQRAD